MLLSARRSSSTSSNAASRSAVVLACVTVAPTIRPYGGLWIPLRRRGTAGGQGDDHGDLDPAGFVGVQPGDQGLLTESYVLGQGGEQLTNLSWSGTTSTWQRTNVYGASKLLATYDAAGLHFHLTDPLGTRRVQANTSGEPELDCQSLPFDDQAELLSRPCRRRLRRRLHPAPLYRQRTGLRIRQRLLRGSLLCQRDGPLP